MSQAIVPLALAGAAVLILGGSKSKKSRSGTAKPGTAPSIPTDASIPSAYGPDAARPPSTTDSAADWKMRQEALTALSKMSFSFEGREIPLCAKCNPGAIDGKPGQNTRNAVKAFQALAGIDRHITVQDLRRTHVDVLRDEEVDPAVEHATVGHSSHRMREHYSTVRSNERYLAAEAVARVLVPKRESNGS